MLRRKTWQSKFGIQDGKRSESISCVHNLQCRLLLYHLWPDGSARRTCRQMESCLLQVGRRQISRDTQVIARELTMLTTIGPPIPATAPIPGANFVGSECSRLAGEPEGRGSL